jgi:hypothetical protein
MASVIESRLFATAAMVVFRAYRGVIAFARDARDRVRGVRGVRGVRCVDACASGTPQPTRMSGKSVARSSKEHHQAGCVADVVWWTHVQRHRLR